MEKKKKKKHNNKLLLEVKIENTRNREIQDKCILTYKNTIVLCSVTDGNMNCPIHKIIIIIIIIILNRVC